MFTFSLGHNWASIMPLSFGALVDLDMTIVIQFVIFLLMFLLLRSLLFKPTLRLIQARYEATTGTRNKAKDLLKEVEILNEDIEQQMQGVRASAATERSRLIEKARTQGRDLFSGARTECHELTNTANAEAKLEADAVAGSLKSEIPSLARMAAGAVLGRDIEGAN